MAARTHGILALVITTTALLSFEARADTTSVLLIHFVGEDEVTILGEGASSEFIEVLFSTFVRLANDPYVGDPEVIVAGAGVSLEFDYNFYEAAGNNDEFSAVLFSAGPNGGPFAGALIRQTIDDSQSGTLSFDLSPYVGQTLGFEFELRDLDGNDATDSTLTVSNVRLVPEPSRVVLIASGLLGILCLPRKFSGS